VVANAIAAPATVRSRRTRAAVLDAARELIESGGFAALSMAAVGERAGVSRRGVYLHFASRAELVTALFDHVSAAEGLAGSLQRVADAPTAAAALEEWAAHVARFHPRVLAISRAAQAAADSDPDAAAHLAQVSADQWAACARLARRLAREHALARPWTVTTATDLLWALTSPELLARLLGQRRWPAARLAERFAILLRRTLTGDPEGAPP
jgi:AcrR family transcriptional regulator